jgi:predicted phosphodiesterase
MRLAFFGGVYSNHLALAAAIRDAKQRGADAMYCLGDLGAFGPHPDHVFPLLQQQDVVCLQGNYDHSIGNELDDCQCGYTDPKDNYFAQISYEYTLANTDRSHRRWMRDLPGEVRFEEEGVRFLLCHGSPRKTNEFLWESTTSTHFLEKLADDYDADIILGTHTGIHWQRVFSSGKRFVNVGALGRPENDGRTNVWYTMIRIENGTRKRHAGAVQAATDSPLAHIDVEFVPLDYDYRRLAGEMRDEGLPEEFIETIRTGWWTTCLEVLPSKERRRGRW